MQTQNSNIQEYLKLLQVKGMDIKLTLLQDVTGDKKKITIFCRTHTLQTQKIDTASKDAVEKCLHPIWSNVQLLKGAKRLGIVEVRFATIEDAIKFSISPLKMAELAMLTHCGQEYFQD